MSKQSDWSDRVTRVSQNGEVSLNCVFSELVCVGTLREGGGGGRAPGAPAGRGEDRVGGALAR